MISSARIRPIIRKEFRQILRDRRSLGVLLVVPAFMLIMFGYALNYDVRHLRLAVYDQDQSSTSRAFADEFTHSEYFYSFATLTSERQIDSVITSQVACDVVLILQLFSRDIIVICTLH